MDRPYRILNNNYYICCIIVESHFLAIRMSLIQKGVALCELIKNVFF